MQYNNYYCQFIQTNFVKGDKQQTIFGLIVFAIHLGKHYNISQALTLTGEKHDSRSKKPIFSTQKLAL